MKTLLFAFLVCFANAAQDRYALNNLYKNIKTSYQVRHASAQGGIIEKDDRLERFAQEAGCVLTHDDHRSVVSNYITAF